MFLSELFVVWILAHNINGLRWRVPGNDCELVYDEPCTSKADIKFEMVSTGNLEDKPILLDPYKPQIPKSYNLSTPWKIIIHGYGGKLFDDSDKLVKAYSTTANISIITVDWTALSLIPCYPEALLNTWQVGRCTSILLTSLTALGVKPDSMHPIGFSLGAHVAGITGQLYLKVFKTKLQRITGLDPALPLYATLSFDPIWILDADDAFFVDIIHTNSGVYGKITNTGDVDFYVNGGTHQPFCANSTTERLCSHLMAPRYFGETITTKTGFWGTPCPSYLTYWFGGCRESSKSNQTSEVAPSEQVLMGEYCPKTARGVYFVKTFAESPFAMGLH